MTGSVWVVILGQPISLSNGYLNALAEGDRRYVWSGRTFYYGEVKSKDEHVKAHPSEELPR